MAASKVKYSWLLKNTVLLNIVVHNKSVRLFKPFQLSHLEHTKGLLKNINLFQFQYAALGRQSSPRSSVQTDA